MKKLLICIALFLIINSVAAEYLVNRANSWAATGGFCVMFAVTLWYLIILPLKQLK